MERYGDGAWAATILLLVSLMAGDNMRCRRHRHWARGMCWCDWQHGCHDMNQGLIWIGNAWMGMVAEIMVWRKPRF